MARSQKIRHEDLGILEDSEYREVMRRGLNQRRADIARGRGRTGDAFVGLLLLGALIAVMAHYYGFLNITP